MFGAEGIKVTCSGRLAGAEIARTEWYRDGRVPRKMVVRPDGIWEARSKAANRCVIPVEGPGIYIVRAGSESFKVIVK